MEHHSDIDIAKEYGRKYHKIISDSLGFKIDTKKFCVHHIDHNRGNNDITNLLVMPKKMHNKYHLLYNFVCSECENLTTKAVGVEYIHQNIETIKKYVDVKEEMFQIQQTMQSIAYNRYIYYRANKEFDSERCFYSNLEYIFKKYM